MDGLLNAIKGRMEWRSTKKKEEARREAGKKGCGGIQQVWSRDGIAYVLYGRDGLVLYDLSEPSEPKELVRKSESRSYGCTQLSEFRQMVEAKGILYVTNGHNGLRIYLRNQNELVELGNMAHTKYAARGVAVHNDVAYVTFGEGGLRTLDVSDPSHPVEIGSFTLNEAHPADLIQVVQGWAYVSFSNGGGLRILDVTQPSFPVEMGVYFHANHALTSLVVRKTHMYLTYGVGGIKVLDMSNPSLPMEIGAFNFLGYPTLHIGFFDHYAYVSLGHGGLRILDCADSSNLMEVGSFCRGGGVPIQSTHVSQDKYAFVVFQDGTLGLLDVQNPKRILPIGQLDPLRDKAWELCSCLPLHPWSFVMQQFKRLHTFTKRISSSSPPTQS